MKPKLQSSASLFEKRGDRWGGKNVHLGNPRPQTPAEEAIDKVALELGGKLKRWAGEDAELRRQANYDDPEMDQFTKAKKASLKVEYKERAGSPATATAQRRAFGNTIGMRKAMMHHPHRIEEKAKPIAPETQRAKLRAIENETYVYVKREDGTEEDHWKANLKRAEQAMKWYRGRKNVVEVEIWNNKTGKLVKRWARPLALGAKK